MHQVGRVHLLTEDMLCANAKAAVGLLAQELTIAGKLVRTV